MIKTQKLKISEVNARAVADPEGFITQSEADYSFQIDNAVQTIIDRMKGSPIVMLSGPSGSGKTTSAFRLKEKLIATGITAHTISLDNYFHTLDIRKAPRTPNGDLDLESPLCLDIELINEHFDSLQSGEEIKIPRYDFIRKERSASRCTKLSLGPNEIAIFEGIHALNDQISGPHPLATRLYISASTDFYDDVGTKVFDRTWLRLMRRVVRDNSFRGSDAAYTIEMWKNVLRGEHLYIDPYKDKADVLINSAMPYEVCLFKHFAEPLFRALPEGSGPAEEIEEIVLALEKFVDIPVYPVPGNSIIREFIGGSIYDYS